MAMKKVTGKTVLITGANKGMGYQTALALASRNCKVIMADKDDQTQSRQKIIKETCNENIVAKHLDLASFKSIRSFANETADEEEHLDVLINNAGVFCMKNRKTCDGFDGVMQVNHLGPFLLTHLLVDLLRRSGKGRIVFVASNGAFFHNLTLESLQQPQYFSPNILSTALNYYNTKLCNMIVSKGFGERLKEWNITSNCLHPGMTNTDFLVKTAEDDDNLEKVMKKITKNALRYTTSDARKTAGLAVFLAMSRSVQDVSEQYFVDYQVHREPRVLEDVEFCNKIWSESETLIGIGKEENKEAMDNETV